jgi:hypothetical protein
VTTVFDLVTIGGGGIIVPTTEKTGNTWTLQIEEMRKLDESGNGRENYSNRLLSQTLSARECY